MRRLKVGSTIAALAALLFFAVPTQADEIEPEPAMEPAAQPEREPEPEPEEEPEPEPAAQATPTRTRDDDYARNGAYVMGNLAGAWYMDFKQDTKDALEALGYAFNLKQEDPLGLGARVGYRFHPRLAGEAQLQWFAKATIEASAKDEPTTDVLKFDALLVTGNLKGYLLTGRIQPYALAGAGLMHVSVDDKLGLDIYDSNDAFAGRFGGGIDFYVNRHVAAMMEGGYVLPTSSLKELKHVYWTVGLQWRF